MNTHSCIHSESSHFLTLKHLHDLIYLHIPIILKLTLKCIFSLTHADGYTCIQAQIHTNSHMCAHSNNTFTFMCVYAFIQ